MDKNILILSSSTDFTTKFRNLLKKRELDYPIIEATGEKTIEVAREYVAQGTRAIITRGGNLEILRSNLINAVLVDVRYTYEDMYFSFKKAKKYSNKIACIGLNLAFDVATKFKNISGEDFLLINPESVNHIDTRVKKLTEEGIEVVIGGITVARAAKKYNLKSVMIEVDETSLEIALNEAISILNFKLEQLKNFETIKQILNTTADGIVAFDKTLEIMYINNRAKKLITDKSNTFAVDHIKNLPKIRDTIEFGTETYSELIENGDNSLVLSSRPLKVGNIIFGAVVSIQKTIHIQTTEKEIRKKLKPKGHIAKKYFHDIIGKSYTLSKTIEKAKRFAKSDSTILITGQSGTGKEIFAQSIHNYSERRDEPFVAINCAALPISILESELFGYVRGAFTGARPEGKAGIFELAHNGTVFLDEIGELSQDIQVKLLRVIQEREVIRIGDDKVIPVDVRIISATNKNLLEGIKKNTFREDLYYRLCVLDLELPALEERKEDIPELVKHFILMKAPDIKITLEAQYLLNNLSYEGNIRQLNNIIERLIVMCENNVIDEQLVADVLGLKSNNLENKALLLLHEEKNENTNVILKMEYQLIKETLGRFNGNKTKAAKELGISYTTLWRKLKNM